MPSLSIKDDRVFHRAKELAQLTGQTVTAAVGTAIDRKIDMEKQKREPLLYKGDDFVHTDVRSALLQSQVLKTP